MWFLNWNCWRPSNSDNTKKHRDNTPNIWPQSLHSPDPPISWAEQVVLIFHAFNVFATLIPPTLASCLFLIPREPISLSFVLVLLLGGSCSARQNAEHSSGALASSHHSHLSVSPRRCSCVAFSSTPSPSTALLPPFFFPLSYPSPVPFLLPSFFPSHCGCWLGVWVLVAAVCCV